MQRFDPDTINEIGQRHLGKPLSQLFTDIGRDLKAIYADYVDTDQPLVFNSAGGIMYQLKIFAMTPHEYIMICGSSIGSSGHSGRHPVAFSDTVLSGEAHYMHEGELDRRCYGTGERIFVDKWQAATINFPDHCWMLEYARGTLPLLLPFGMANTLNNTLDFVSAFKLMRIYLTFSARYFQKHPEERRPYLAVGGVLLMALPILLRRRNWLR
jgi:hypothetical protein